MWFAALGQFRREDRTEEQKGDGFVIITADSDQGMLDIHDRRPVVLPIAARPSAKAVARDVIIGNRSSRVYHLPQDCPSYAKVAPKNQEIFSNESAAIAAGYRKAGNCR